MGVRTPSLPNVMGVILYKNEARCRQISKHLNTHRHVTPIQINDGVSIEENSVVRVEKTKRLDSLSYVALTTLNDIGL